MGQIQIPITACILIKEYYERSPPNIGMSKENKRQQKYLTQPTRTA